MELFYTLFSGRYYSGRYHAQGHDITKERRLEEENDAALIQIQKNLAQLAILNDEIRNPLMIITMSVDRINDCQVTDLIIGQAKRIDEMVSQLDQRWAESEKVLNALTKHYYIHAVPLTGSDKADDTWGDPV